MTIRSRTSLHCVEMPCLRTRRNCNGLHSPRQSKSTSTQAVALNTRNFKIRNSKQAGNIKPFSRNIYVEKYSNNAIILKSEHSKAPNVGTLRSVNVELVSSVVKVGVEKSSPNQNSERIPSSDGFTESCISIMETDRNRYENGNINLEQAVELKCNENATSLHQWAKKEVVESFTVSNSSDLMLISHATEKYDSASEHNKTRINEKNRRNPPYCKICSKIFTSYKMLAKHKGEHTGEKPYKCLHCEQTYTNLDELTAHLRLHQGKLPYECKKCHVEFRTVKDYMDHQPLHILRKAALVERQHECEFCCKKFKKISDLERHTRVHTGEKPAVCNICNKRFHQTHNLTKHLLIHIQARPFECEVCGKAFRRSDVLSRHVFTHSLVKPYHCSNCNRGFIRLSQLNAHVCKVAVSKKSIN